MVMAPPRKRQTVRDQEPVPTPSPALEMVGRFKGPEFSGSASKHPLLIGEIVDHVLSYLGTDLVACFDVCELWRSLVPHHNIRYRSARPPVVIRGDMREKKGGAQYLELIRKHPSFKATKFAFRNADLQSEHVRYLFEVNGSEIEELELCYEGILGRQLTTSDLAQLLQEKTTNLKRLIIKDLPPKVQEADLFPTGSASALASLKRIEIATNCKFSRNDPYYNGQPSEPLPFLLTLFRASPKLEEIKVIDWKSHANSSRFACRIVNMLHRADRLTQIRVFEFSRADPQHAIQEFGDHLLPGQFRTFSISKAVFHYRHQEIPPEQQLASVKQFLASQAQSLEYLELPLARHGKGGMEARRPWTYAGVPILLQLPPMPNLVELKLLNNEDPRPLYQDRLSLQDSLNYATDFPQLRLLSLKGQLYNYVEEEIYPELALPCHSVQVLQEIPLGVDQGLMARIGRLFPNVTIIRTPILHGRESLVVAIWEFCPNISELFLTFDGDGDPYREKKGQEQGTDSLDSLFTGIPEAECGRLRALPPGDQLQELTNLDFERLRAEAGSRSIYDLGKLKRLVIDGPSSSLGGHGVKYSVRGDKLSDIFSLSTVGSGKMRNLTFFQARVKMMELSPDAIKIIGERSGLQAVTEGCKGFDESCVRIIRPGAGFEGLGPIPKEWYGLSGDA